MKNFYATAMALLVLCFAGSALAIQAEIPDGTTAAIAKGSTQVTIGGEIRFRGTTYQNINDFDKNAKSTATTHGGGERSVYESRIRLSIEAKVSPNTIGFVQLEAGPGENINWGSAGNVFGSIKSGEDKANAMQLIQGWIQHSGSGLFGTPAYIKIGHQPIVIGSGRFYRHNLYGDDAIVVGLTPLKGLDLTALTVKLSETGVGAKASNNGIASEDDVDLYSGMISYAINKDIKIGADLSYLDLHNTNALTGSATDAINYKGGLFNLGLNAKVNLSGLALYGTLDIQTGSIKSTTDKIHFRGYAVTAGAAYTFAPVTIALDLAYGSGDDKSNNKNSTFMTAQSHIPTLAFVYDHITNNGAGNMAGALQNTMMAKLSASVDITKDINAGASLILLQAAKKIYGGGLLTSTSGINADPTRNPTSRYIGTELDANISYQIEKNLKYYVEGGYLFAGKFWKAPVTGSTSGKVSDPWSVRHGFILNF